MKIDVAYQSPVICDDPLARTEIFEARNSQTGSVSYQVPSVATVKQLETAPPQAASGADVVPVAAPQPTAAAPASKTPVTETSGGFSLIV